ncbi:MAG: cytochrome-c peroxidase [Deltaproteobacteria bacterium]|nr:cytochrome-c peroxidase [Deltaproteobacteria bacterium]
MEAIVRNWIWLLIFSQSLLAAQKAKLELPWGALPKNPPIPKDNPMTPEKIYLGRQLYMDPRLSKDGTVSCNSCHNVMASGGDNRAFSAGIKGQLGGRSAPTVWNSAFHTVQFWDGRAASLEDQAKGPLTNPIEMGMASHDIVMERISKIPGYVSQFKKVFGEKGMRIDNLAKAIAAYERTLITPNSAFDRYVRGDKKAMSAQAIRGMNTVMEVGCVSCHTGKNFNAPDEITMGEGFYQKFPTFTDNEYVKKYNFLEDKGRGSLTKDPNDDYFFRVPTWRNIALTAPYFSNGSVKTLDEAVRVMAKIQLNKDLTVNQVSDIVEFLKALTGERPKQPMPELPPDPAGDTTIDG